MNSKKSVSQHFRKRSFQLFELLISLALIALCLFPLIKPLATMRKADCQYLEEIQLARAMQIAFCSLKEKLYENREHSWEELLSGVKGELPEKFTIATGKLSRKTYRCTYCTRRIDSIKKTSMNMEALVLEIDFFFSPTPFWMQENEPSFQRTLYLERSAV